MDDNKYVIEMNHISKFFPGIRANDDITLKIKKGEIHALLGENGAGKSTLMSVLFGLYQPEEGNIIINGQEVKINDPNDANNLGIGMVHQHFKLVDVFTVLDNIILGCEPLLNLKVDKKNVFLSKMCQAFNFINKNVFHIIDKKEAEKKVKYLSNKYGLNVDLSAKVEDITVGMQQRTEILKMLYRDNDILIFDEPTAVLTPQEIDELLKIMKSLASEGKSILFISHKLNEIMEICDRVTVLRKGKLVKTLNIKDTNKEELSRLMCGHDINFVIDKKQSKPGEVILEVKDLKMKDKIHKSKNSVDGVSFNVKKGEIVCIAGIDGNGQSELIYGITGLDKIKSGEVLLKGENVTNKSIFKRNNLGMAHIPEDRHKHGLVLDYRLDENMILENYWKDDFSKHHFLKKKDITKYSDKLIDTFDIRSSEGSNVFVRSMSGGNQQKAIIAREIDRNCELLIAVQPTRGLDIGAIEYIHKQLIKQRDENKAVLLVSFELDEVINLADRILVMYEGKITGELNPKETTFQELGLYMSGAKKQNIVEEGL
ncbi:MAG: ABC transporter ATP-binding protein [Erysipelotrichaceae bacterium]|nr:ABC transporter ATP-binding protein [Erysipelotrichaceae bacterium]